MKWNVLDSEKGIPVKFIKRKIKKMFRNADFVEGTDFQFYKKEEGFGYCLSLVIKAEDSRDCTIMKEILEKSVLGNSYWECGDFYLFWKIKNGNGFKF